jgi:hypothetical protein
VKPPVMVLRLLPQGLRPLQLTVLWSVPELRLRELQSVQLTALWSVPELRLRERRSVQLLIEVE